ncbi:hypothetical protein POR1_46 [Pseudomonas phage POR1]|uniref:Uncharacterized protein n=1 Tax=Pseudomonas phage POR1 TaxID=1718594 RepID=A0A0N9SJD9_9CAUD|nr:hypothetical protein POR1_46 [Pseudomonas phage POR1]
MNWPAELVAAWGGYSPDNPSPAHCRAVKVPLPVPTRCRWCGGNVEAVEMRHVIGHNEGWPFMYRCEECGAGCYMHEYTNIPTGILRTHADRKLYRETWPLWKEYAERHRLDFTQQRIRLSEWTGYPRQRCVLSALDADDLSRVLARLRAAAEAVDLPPSAKLRASVPGLFE